jgi:hypothetical protein
MEYMDELLRYYSEAEIRVVWSDREIVHLKNKIEYTFSKTPYKACMHGHIDESVMSKQAYYAD